MIDGEKMIWAAVFARECSRLRYPPNKVKGANKGKEYVLWEQHVAITAAEVATLRVQLLRESMDRLRRARVGTDIVVKMTEIMVGEREHE